MPDATLRDHAAAFRRFNRHYTRFIGTVTDRFLRTPYSLAEGRVLYELATRDRPRAKDIAEALGMDAGYLSRVLTKHERAGLLKRKPSKTDSRAADLLLTPKGRAVFRVLNQRSEKQARDVLTRMPAPTRARFIEAISTMEHAILRTDAEPPAFTLRSHRPGDMGVIVALEGKGYVDQFGWDSTFEALVARIVADFLDHFDPQKERCWVAEIPSATEVAEHVGHIFLVRHPEQPGTAKLRLLYVDPKARGLGLGHTLVTECVRFAREAGYQRITLWTQSILTAAHRLYQQAGFQLVREESHHSFGKDLLGQTWELDLK
jgi:DNA-binding MarR family transcriptional regulator/GNAT superfamily N-acetyltransferase